jgi:hypothetical protein
VEARLITLSFLRGINPRVRETVSLSWDDLVSRLTADLQRTCRDKLQQTAFAPCAFADDRRATANAGPHTALVIDVDHCDPDALLAACDRWRCFVYETASSTDDAPRFRVVADLPAPYPANAIAAARQAFAAELGLDPRASGVDGAKAAAQIFFVGRVVGTRPRHYHAFDGAVWTPPDPANVVAYDAPTEGEPSEPWRDADDVPDLSLLAAEIAPDPDDPTQMHRGGRDVSRAIGGWLARKGYHPDAIAEAVHQYMPTRQPDQRALEATDTAEQWYSGDTRAAGWGVLAERWPETMQQLDDLLTDPWVEAVAARWERRQAEAREPVGAAAPTEPASPAVPSDADALAALPLWVRAHVLAAQEELRTPLAMNIGFALGALAAACAGRLTVRVTHSYSFHTALYVCVVGSPSDYKSPAHNMACRPISAWAAQQATDQRPLLAELAEFRDECKAKRDALKDKRTRGYAADERPPVTPEETALALKLADPEPVPFRYVVGDITNEKLSDMLAQHGRLACLSSEAGKVFSVLEGAYAGKAELGVWLKAYDGEFDPVDRLNRVAEVPRYLYTVLSACLAIQPSVLEGLGSNPSLSGQGFLQRFCWVLSESVPVRWAPGEEPAPMPQDVATTYDQRLTALLERPAHEVRLSDAARKGPYLAYRDDLEARKKGDLGTTKELEGWVGKQLQRVGRIAALLWAADGSEGEIAPEHMARAVVIGRWLEGHAIRTLGAELDVTDAALLACVQAKVAKLGRPVTLHDFHSSVPRVLKCNTKERDRRLENLLATGQLVRVGARAYR